MQNSIQVALDSVISLVNLFVNINKKIKLDPR